MFTIYLPGLPAYCRTHPGGLVIKKGESLLLGPQLNINANLALGWQYGPDSAVCKALFAFLGLNFLPTTYILGCGA